MLDDRGGRPPRRRRGRRPGEAAAARRGGIEPQAHLAAALVGERRQPIGEGRARLLSPALDFFFSPEPAEKRGTLPPGMKIRSPVRGFTPCRGTTLGNGELAEAGEVDLAPILEDLGDGVEQGVDGVAGLLLVADPAVAREHVRN